jgi:dihydrofolate reductase
MRKLIVCNHISVDGYYDGPGHNVMAMPMDPAADGYYLDRMKTADTLLLGRTSYEGFIGFWPPKADDLTAPEVHREFGALYRTHAKVVVSDSLAADGVTVWQETTTVVQRADAADWLAEAKARPGRDILTFGSRTTWTPLLAAGLVDELHLMVGAGALTDGTPLFAEPVSGLRLLEARRIEGSNVALLSYGVAAG